jgi:hypothetical protein
MAGTSRWAISDLSFRSFHLDYRSASARTKTGGTSVPTTNSFDDQVKALGNVLKALADLDSDGQQFVVQTAATRLGLVVGAAGAQLGTGGVVAAGAALPSIGAGQTPADPNTTPKQFLDIKRPATDVERVTCLGFYLTHFRATPHFKTADITSLNTEAAQKPLSNTSVAVGNAQTTNYLTKAGKRGEKQVTSFGEKVVHALPDRETLKAVMEAESKRGARRPKKKAAKKRPAK